MPSRRARERLVASATRQRLVDGETRHRAVARPHHAELARGIRDRDRDLAREQSLAALEQGHGASLDLQAPRGSRAYEALEAARDEVGVPMRASPRDQRIPCRGTITMGDRERDRLRAHRGLQARRLSAYHLGGKPCVRRVLSRGATRQLGPFVEAPARGHAARLGGQRRGVAAVTTECSIERAVSQSVLGVERAADGADTCGDLGIVLVFARSHRVGVERPLEIT